MIHFSLEEPPEWKPGVYMDPLSPDHLVLVPQMHCFKFLPGLRAALTGQFVYSELIHTGPTLIDTFLVYFQCISVKKSNEFVCLGNILVYIFGLVWLVCLLLVISKGVLVSVWLAFETRKASWYLCCLYWFSLSSKCFDLLTFDS